VHRARQSAGSAPQRVQHRIASFADAPCHDVPGVGGVTALVGGELSERLPNLRNLGLSNQAGDDACRYAFVQNAIDQRVDGETRESQDSRSG